MAMFRTFGRNLPYFNQQFRALLGNTSTSIQLVCVVVIIGYCLSFSKEAVKVLSVTPGYLMPSSFWLWTVFTFWFLELHFWEVLVDIVTVGLCGKLIEPLWGQFEMLLFFAIVNFGVAILSTIFYYINYMCTFDPDILFTIHIHGLAGYIAGVSVAVKQIMPDLILIKTPLGKLSNRNVPLSVFFTSLLLWIMGLLEGTYPTMFLSGLIVSWVYLRFYQRHSNGSRGDMADYFTFASFFPNVVQPPIAVISNTTYGALVKIGLCKKVVRRFDMANPTGVTVSIPGVDQHDMERRRQIALKALSERLSKSHDARDKQPLIPKSNSKIVLPPNTFQTSSPSTSRTFSPIVVPAPVISTAANSDTVPPVPSTVVATSPVLPKNHSST
ncbi:transmembrane protein 115 isoform X2 [Agrilus planipennis]|uniref:Transmembrane protein 115 isoform X2 n=1 Tax=Agrilus planipennis TaxID=224129 RepID=A0A1W4XUI8_AGRPL|nr:transmembrane protein 115 isoform X2 [Agrilus planipennis]